MRIQIDTASKVIRVEQRVSFKELTEFLDRILPGEWKSFELDTNVTITNWSSPIIIDRGWKEPYPYFYCDARSNKYLCSSTSTGDEFTKVMCAAGTDGIYNIESKSNADLS